MFVHEHRGMGPDAAEPERRLTSRLARDHDRFQLCPNRIENEGQLRASDCRSGHDREGYQSNDKAVLYRIGSGIVRHEVADCQLYVFRSHLLTPVMFVHEHPGVGPDAVFSFVDPVAELAVP